MAIGQAEQVPNLPRSASYVESFQCNSHLFNRVAGQVEVLAGQVNFRGSLPCSASKVLEPVLHPLSLINVYLLILIFTCHLIFQIYTMLADYKVRIVFLIPENNFLGIAIQQWPPF